MSPADADRARQFAYRATEISALCDLLGTALTLDPDTYLAGAAIEGIGKLATALSNDVLALTEGD